MGIAFINNNNQNMYGFNASNYAALAAIKVGEAITAPEGFVKPIGLLDIDVSL